MSEPMVTKRGILDMQVCVPKEWTDEQVLYFAEKEFPCGTQNGWHIRREGSELLFGSPERVTCANDDNNVHIMLDA